MTAVGITVGGRDVEDAEGIGSRVRVFSQGVCVGVPPLLNAHNSTTPVPIGWSNLDVCLHVLGNESDHSLILSHCGLCETKVL